MLGAHADGEVGRALDALLYDREVATALLDAARRFASALRHARRRARGRARGRRDPGAGDWTLDHDESSAHRRRRVRRIAPGRGAARPRPRGASSSTTCRPDRWTTSRTSRAGRGFEYVIDTVMNEPLMAELIDRADIVFHLAAAVGVKLIVEAPVRTIETNVHGTEVVLTHASKKGKLVVIFSTSEVYGKSTAVPFHEDADLVMGPTPKHRWAYACSKAHRRVPGAGLLPRARAAGRSSCGSSTPSARGRPAATAWSFRTSSGRRSPARRSPSTATARRRARSPTSATSSTG